MMNLTKDRINSFKYDGRARDVRWDSRVPGFGIRLYPPTENGSKKSFVLSYRNEGQKRLIVLSGYGELTVDQARELAKDKLHALRKDGIDPLHEKRANRTGKTFKDLKEKYIEHKRLRGNKTWKNDEARLDRHIPPGWSSRQVSTIEAHEIERLHKKIGKTAPYEANRLLALLRHMFKLGARSAWNYILPKGHTNPCLEIEKFPEQKRKRFATAIEVKAIGKAIDDYDNIYVRAALWLYLLTGARKTELLGARWRDLDMDEEILHLPQTKAGEPQIISLNAPALAIIKAIPKQKENPYIFVGSKKKHHLVNISKPWLKIRKQAGCHDLRLHDLRRTVGTWMTRVGVDLNTIKAALRHADISTTLTYAHAGEEVARVALEEHGENIMRAIGKTRINMLENDKSDHD